MTHSPLRLLPDLCADGPSHMASDEALLEASEGLTLRCYTWNPATISLGYFQKYATVYDRIGETTASVTPFVRRITGGGAIWHEHEVTYALVGTLDTHLPAQTAAVYQLLHQAIRSALADQGAALDTQTKTVGDRRYDAEPRCFASPAADDLIIESGKVLGSAARTRGQRLLVHGSLKLASNPWDGDVAVGCGVDAATARDALITGIATALNASIEPGEWTEAEIAARERIRAVRYSNEAWVQRREGPRP